MLKSIRLQKQTYAFLLLDMEERGVLWRIKFVFNNFNNGGDMTRKKKFMCLFMALTFSITMLTSPSSVALAEEVETMQSELDTITQKMKEQLNKVMKFKQQVNTVAGQLDEIETDLDEKRGELRSVESRMLATQRQIEENQKLLEKTEKNLNERSRVLHKRVRDLYMFGQISYVDILFGASDFTDFATRYELLKRVVQSDKQLIEKAKADRELISKKKAELERDVAAVEELRKVAAEKRNMVASRYQAKRSVLDNLETQQDEAQRAYDELQRSSNRIEQMIRARKGGQGPSGGIVTGSYMWPTNGVVTSNFGWRTHPVFGNQRLHAGMDIGADYGENIYAADGGTVISVGWISGYGKTVIIEHNGTYSTLYAHSSELLVNEGQIVRKGQLIARVGETGYTTGPNLHFEVRVNGAPQNPRDYLP